MEQGAVRRTAPLAGAPLAANKWAVLAAVGLGTYLSVLDSSVVNISLPTITRELHTDTTTIQWVVMAYLLVITGLLLAWMNGYITQALTFQRTQIAIGIGMWLALIMAFNVWFIIWPNQKKALGLVDAAPEQKAAAAKTATMTSRINTMLSIPMLMSMVAFGHGGFFL
jgi:uncharacterized membrane protein